MSRAAGLAGAFLAGAATVLLVLYGALCAAPGVIMADDMVAALLVVAEPPLTRFARGATVYVQSSAGPLLLEELKRRHPSLTLLSFTARPESADCPGHLEASALCGRDDFVKLEVLSAPARGTMLVAVATGRSFGQVLLLRFFGRWRVIVDRWYPL